MSFRTPKQEESTILSPDYSPHLAAVAACIAVLLGKRFDVHGLTEEHGRFRAPDVSQYASLCDPQLGFNSHQPRRAFAVKLEVSEFNAVSGLLVDDDDAMKLLTAVSFYMRALQTAERDPEVAYLHLITAGEIVAGSPKTKIRRTFVRSLASLLDSEFFRSESKPHFSLTEGRGGGASRCGISAA